MENKMIRFVLKSAAIMMLVSFLAIVVLASTIIYSSGNATRLSQSDAYDAAYSHAESGLMCSGSIENIQVTRQECTGMSGVTPINCTVTVSATCNDNQK